MRAADQPIPRPHASARMAFRPDLQTTLDRYAHAWNTPDPDERWALVHACAASGVVYVDPGSEKPVRGQAALAAFMGLFHETARQEFAFTGAADGHHEWIRVPWQLRDAAGPTASGLLVATLDRDVRLVQLVDFVDA